MAVPQQEAVGAQGAAGAAAQALRGAAGFRQAAGHEQHGQQRGNGDSPEHGAPAAPLDQEAAEQRRQDGRDAEHQREQRHHARRLGPGVQVAHHGARHHHAGAGAQALHKAPGHQALDVGRQGAAHAGHGKHGQAKVQRLLAPQHVGGRAVHHLPQAQRHKKGHQAGLHPRGRGAQAGAYRGQGRQVHVDGKRAYGLQQAQDQGDTEKGCEHAHAHGPLSGCPAAAPWAAPAPAARGSPGCSAGRGSPRGPAPSARSGRPPAAGCAAPAGRA